MASESQHNAAWNLNSRSDEQLKQPLTVSNLNKLTSIRRNTTLTLAGTT